MNDALKVIRALILLIEVAEDAGLEFEAVSNLVKKARAEKRDISNKELDILRANANKSLSSLKS